jgi:hypothetical protein
LRLEAGFDVSETVGRVIEARDVSDIQKFGSSTIEYERADLAGIRAVNSEAEGCATSLHIYSAPGRITVRSSCEVVSMFHYLLRDA